LFFGSSLKTFASYGGVTSSIMGGFFALLAAFSFTVDNILTRKGLMEENPGSVWEIRFAVSLTSLSGFLAGVIIASLFGLNVIQEFMVLSVTDVLLLVFAGLLGPLVGALLFTSAIAQIGASHASALWGGSNPLFTMLFAIAILGEMPDLIGLISVLIIVGGIVVVGYHGHEGTVMLLEKTKLAGGVIALLSGICVSFSQIGRGAALSQGATPNTAFFIFQFTSFIVMAAVCFTKAGNFKFLKEISGKSLYCYIGAGIGILVGAYSLLISFTLMPIWQAVAIRNIQPILVVIFSWMFLKKVDKISWRLVMGATLVTLGVVILNVYK
jgi:drug/metabolite transporter, DME family